MVSGYAQRGSQCDQTRSPKKQRRTAYTGVGLRLPSPLRGRRPPPDATKPYVRGRHVAPRVVATGSVRPLGGGPVEQPLPEPASRRTTSRKGQQRDGSPSSDICILRGRL